MKTSVSHKNESFSGATPQSGSMLQNNLRQFVYLVEHDLKEKKHHHKKSIEKLAFSLGITDKTEIKELTELAIVNRARELAHNPHTIRQRFNSIVELYNSQVNLSHRTSQSILLQQYSTPAPIGYLAGVFCGIINPSFVVTILNLLPEMGY